MSNNNFLDGIYPPLSVKEFSKKIKHVPIGQKFSTIPEQIIEVNRIVHELFIPLSFHYAIYLKFITCLYLRYKDWNHKDYIICLNELRRTGQIPPNLINLNSVLGFCLIGASGLGKTAALNKIRGLIPLMYHHKDYGIKQAPIVAIDNTTKGSTKQLCIAFFSQLGIAVGKNYVEMYKNAGEEALYDLMKVACAMHCVGIIIVDEFHNLIPLKKEARTKIVNNLKELSNKVGIPIVYVGTEQAIPILFSDYQTASRVQGLGVPLLDRFREDNPEWRYFISELWKVQVFENPGELTEELRSAYFNESQGIIRQVRYVHTTAQEIALLNGKSSITPDIILETRKHLKGTSDIIDTLKSKEPIANSKLQGVSTVIAEAYDLGINHNQISETKRVALLTFAKDKFPKVSKENRLRLLDDILSEFGYSDETESIIELFFQNFLNNSASQIVKKALKPSGDLIDICKNALSNQDRYILLEQAGIMSDLSELKIF